MIGLTRFITCMESRGFFFNSFNYEEKKNLRKAERYLQNIIFIRNNSYPSTRFHVAVWYLKINKKIKRGRNKNFQINNFRKLFAVNVMWKLDVKNDYDSIIFDI